MMSLPNSNRCIFLICEIISIKVSWYTKKLHVPKEIVIFEGPNAYFLLRSGVSNLVLFYTMMLATFMQNCTFWGCPHWFFELVLLIIQAILIKTLCTLPSRVCHHKIFYYKKFQKFKVNNEAIMSYLKGGNCQKASLCPLEVNLSMVMQSIA